MSSGLDPRSILPCPHRVIVLFCNMLWSAWTVAYVTIALSLSSGSYAGRIVAVGPKSDIILYNRIANPDGFKRPAALMKPNENSKAMRKKPKHTSVVGPTVVGYKGTNFRLNIMNQLSDPTMLLSTSIHWHGFVQKGTSWADGAAFVTQCPIPKDESFLYDFHVPDQAGTFWYHSHLSTQYCDGIRGAFVVYDRHDPHKKLYDVDNPRTVITLGDWYHVPATQMTTKVPTPDTTLINGRGRYNDGPVVPLAKIRVVHGKRYRFRLINIGCDPNYVFSIDNHELLVIEADAVNIEPYKVDSIQIFAGQRYSFVLHANQPIDNYRIRANPNLGTTGFEGGLNSAILRYHGAPRRDPTTTSKTTKALKETEMVPLEFPGAPGIPEVGKADVNINLNFNFTAKPEFAFTINGETFLHPNAPVLLQIMSGAKKAGELLPKGTLYPLPANKVIEISFPGFPVGGPHPMHLHGHTFDVVRSAGSSTYNYKNPIRRDVVSGGMAGDNVTIRFITDNPGPWFLHCHIDWHLEIGLAVVFAEATDCLEYANPPRAWDQLCPKYERMSKEQLGGMPTAKPALPGAQQTQAAAGHH
ncbi:hypothetical protein HGRIS_014574 [Hohenbuehelia grisea]|uniref:Laccase n=1 Tax=Hohenbuehelia grisea TaxID=104357 RepID=A0ABR3JVA1_9AGAR